MRTVAHLSMKLDKTEQHALGDAKLNANWFRGLQNGKKFLHFDKESPLTKISIFVPQE